MSWSLDGTNVDGCNCDALCPCLFLSWPTAGECTAFLAWHIEHGHDEGVSLDGLNVALSALVPGKMDEVKWTVAAYIDERGSEAQRQSLLRIFSGQAGGHPAVLAASIGTFLGAKFVPITFDARGKAFSIRIPAIADVAIEAMAGAGGADVVVSGQPLAISPGFPLTVARSKQFDYNDYEFRWSFTGKNAAFSPFHYEG